MKKILFGTTALLAAGAFAPTAQAADPIQLSVGGFMKSWVAVADQDNDALDVNTFDVQQDAEIHFNGKTTLDNGMTVRVRVELETNGDGAGNATDEIYVDVSGKYGAVRLGSDDNAADLMMVMAPSVSPLFGPGDGPWMESFLVPNVTYIEVGDDDTGDATKITYFTPKLYGFQVGASYTPSGNAGNKAADSILRDGDYDESWAAGLSYSNTFGGFGVEAAVTYQNTSDRVVGSNVEGVVENLGAGLQVSYQGFTVGGGYMTKNADRGTFAEEKDGYAWNVGVSYAEGPYAVSMGYALSSVQGDVNVDGEDELAQYQLAGVYKLGAGVDLFAEIDYSNAEDESGVAEAGNEGAIGGAIGLKLSF